MKVDRRGCSVGIALGCGESTVELIIALLAGGQIECIVNSELGCIVLVHVRIVFLKTLLIGLGRINS